MQLAEVFCVKNERSEDKILSNKLKSYLEFLGQKIGSKYNNYFFKKLDLEGHLCYHVLLDKKGEIITGSGIYNGCRYPEFVYRFLNRVFVNPKYRVKSKPLCLATKYILPKQMQDYSHKIKYGFVSREGINGHHFLKYWVQNHAPGGTAKWEVLEDMAHVVPKFYNRKCYQYIAVQKDQKSYWEPKMITLSKWKELP